MSNNVMKKKKKQTYKKQIYLNKRKYMHLIRKKKRNTVK